ncbi:winged helix-turn-helix domain-containing protein [Amycolatopsis sp. ATCC 39116]|uniref:winged helix-turn-helix domain-containing protein n=1 Tax=Amycolatopsis sp. (strain ATCC 39116 / 75iv2) TaxID=385957 RepID=UPI0002626A6B|nr:winged helix-turn-helix domain-containing protein [Amycolatopsis sp. ATCC 39116]
MAFSFAPDPAGYLYDQVADHIEARIRDGELQPDRPLPAERRLAEEYGVAVGTTRHAIRLLQLRGLVRVIPSKGTFVNPPEARPVPGTEPRKHRKPAWPTAE